MYSVLEDKITRHDSPEDLYCYGVTGRRLGKWNFPAVSVLLRTSFAKIET